MFKQRVLFTVLALIGLSVFGSRADAECGSYCGYTGLAQTTGYAPYALAVDLYTSTTTTTTTTPYLGGIGGGYGFGGYSGGLYGGGLYGGGLYGGGLYGGGLYGGGTYLNQPCCLTCGTIFGGGSTGIGSYGAALGVGAAQFGSGYGSLGFGYSSGITLPSIGSCSSGICSGGLATLPYFGGSSALGNLGGRTFTYPSTYLGFGSSGSLPGFSTGFGSGGSIGGIGSLGGWTYPGGSSTGVTFPGVTMPSLNIPAGPNPYAPPSRTLPNWGGCDGITASCAPVGPVTRDPFPIPGGTIGSNPQNPFPLPNGTITTTPVVNDPIRYRIPRGIH